LGDFATSLHHFDFPYARGSILIGSFFSIQDETIKAL
jgi:hypothetical protein